MALNDIIEQLKKKYRQVFFRDYFRKYSEVEQKPSSSESESGVEKDNEKDVQIIKKPVCELKPIIRPEGAYVALFTDDKGENKETIKKLCEIFENSMIYDGSNDETGKNLLKRYESDLEQLLAHKDLGDGQKMADRMKMTLKRTLIKLWAIGDYRNRLVDYFEKSGIYTVTFPEGYVMKDDDLAMLETALLRQYSEKTYDLSEHNKVIQMIQPVIRISYYDEDDETVYFEEIPGNCRFYSYYKEG